MRKAGAPAGGGEVAGSPKGDKQESSLFAQLTFTVPGAVLFSEKQVAGERVRERGGGRAPARLLESEGSAQLWAACLLSVCLSPSKSTPSHIHPLPLSHLSLLSDDIPGLAHF